MVETARVQYVFLDVVGFTRNRSVECQSDVVQALNAVVQTAVGEFGLPSESTVLLPTGDGILIALIHVTDMDMHLRLALRILELVEHFNEITKDQTRKFEVRIGVNENVDNVLADVNGRRNVAGAGVSMARRIMDQADGGQILVGHAVYDTLRQREKYIPSFKAFDASGKHGVNFSVYQFVSKDARGLNIAPPSAFVRRTEPVKLTKLVAYYIAHATVHRSFLLSRKGDPARDAAAIVLLTFLAEDSVEKSETPTYEEPGLKTWGAGKAPIDDQYRHYYGIEFWPLVDFAHLLAEKNLEPYSDLFERDDYFANYAFVSATGIRKLVTEWPKIAEGFGIN